VAKSVISSPDWNHEKEQGEPIVLVHGVYGSGKSFLAAVIIIFLQELIDQVSSTREPEDQIQFKILISSMTVNIICMCL
jgi:DNA helicase HerA-like ATPase